MKTTRFASILPLDLLIVTVRQVIHTVYIIMYARLPASQPPLAFPQRWPPPRRKSFVKLMTRQTYIYIYIRGADKPENGKQCLRIYIYVLIHYVLYARNPLDNNTRRRRRRFKVFGFFTSNVVYSQS